MQGRHIPIDRIINRKLDLGNQNDVDKKKKQNKRKNYIAVAIQTLKCNREYNLFNIYYRNKGKERYRVF